MAANRAALGQLHEAAALLPGASALLQQSYDEAFRHVLHALAGIAVLTALAIQALLGRQRPHAARDGAAATP